VTTLEGLALLIVLGLGVYLFVALLRPEKFQ
jgi:K+-transporting ATPase KdpF subunit